MVIIASLRDPRTDEARPNDDTTVLVDHQVRNLGQRA
jgi:hypothetical protein